MDKLLEDVRAFIQLAQLDRLSEEVTLVADPTELDDIAIKVLIEFTQLYYGIPVELNELGRMAVNATLMRTEQINGCYSYPVDTRNADELNSKFVEVHACAMTLIESIESSLAYFNRDYVDELYCSRISTDVYDKVSSTIRDRLDELAGKVEYYAVYFDFLCVDMQRYLWRSSNMSNVPPEELAYAKRHELDESALDELEAMQLNAVDDTRLIFLRKFLPIYYTTVCDMRQLDAIVKWLHDYETRICSQATTQRAYEKYDDCKAQLKHAKQAICSIYKMLDELDIDPFAHLLGVDLYALCRDFLYRTMEQLTEFNDELTGIERTIRDNLHDALESLLEKLCFSYGSYEDMFESLERCL
jgi:hypothetical protein